MTQETTTTTVPTEVNTSIEKINTGLTAFDHRKAEFTQLATEAKEIQFTVTRESIQDKAAVKLIEETRKKLKKARTGTAKEGKDMRELISPITKAILKAEKDLISIIEPEEERLEQLEIAIDKLKTEIELEEQQKEAARLQVRVNALLQMDMEFTGEEYVFETMRVSAANLKYLTDEQFDEVCREVKVLVDAANARKAEQERIDKLRTYRENKLMAFESFNTENDPEGWDWGTAPEDVFLAKLTRLEGLRAEKDRIDTLRDQRQEELKDLWKWMMWTPQEAKDGQIEKEWNSLGNLSPTDYSLFLTTLKGRAAQAELKETRTAKLRPYELLMSEEESNINWGTAEESFFTSTLITLQGRYEGIQVQLKENERKEKELEENLRKLEQQKKDLKIQRLIALGLKWDGEQFIGDGVNVHWTDIACWSEDQFEQEILGITSHLASIKEHQLEQERQQALFDKRSVQLVDAGLGYDAENNTFTYPDLITIKSEVLIADTEEEFTQRLVVIQETILKHLNEKEQLREALKPDKQKIQEYINALREVPIPEMGTEKGESFLLQSAEKIREVLATLETKANNL